MAQCYLEHGHDGRHEIMFDHAKKAILSWEQDSQSVYDERRYELASKLSHRIWRFRCNGNQNQVGRYCKYRDKIYPEDIKIWHRLDAGDQKIIDDFNKAEQK